MFSLGEKSKKELNGVHPRLRAVVERAIAITLQDFGVHEGVRASAEQDRMFESGASKTRDSKHELQADGFSHAVDLVPYLNGKLRWEWPLIWAVAQAMDQAATELGVEIIWGAVWDRKMSQYGGSATALQKAVDEYKVRHPGPDFLDGPHYQLA